MKFNEMRDDKIGTTVHVDVFGNDFSGMRTIGNRKRYTGKIYSWNKGAGVFTILSPKGQGYRVIQAKPENVSKAQKQSDKKFVGGKYVV
jgi:hypothetical protein